MPKQHRICRSYSFRKHIIEEGQLFAKNELQRNTDTLHAYYLQLEDHAQHWQPSIDQYVFAQCHRCNGETESETITR